MRRVLVHVGADGKSKVLSDAEPVTTFGFSTTQGSGDDYHPQAERLSAIPATVKPGDAVITEMWRSSAGVSPTTGDPTRDMASLEPGAAPDTTCWRICRFGPNREAPMHNTHTLDYDFVLEGEVTLLLEEGEVLLRAGDSVVLPGVLHGWRAGAAGCTISVAMVGMTST